MANIGVSQSEFAVMKGWHRSRVSQLKKLDPSPIVFTPAGLIDVEATELKLAASQAADKEGVRQRHARERATKPHEAEVPLPGADGEAEDRTAGARVKDESYAKFNAARAGREEENLAIARMARMEKEGTLVRKDDVTAAAGEIGQLLIQGLESMGVKIAPDLAAESDPVACQAIIDKYIRQLRVDLAAKLRALYPADAGN